MCLLRKQVLKVRHLRSIKGELGAIVIVARSYTKDAKLAAADIEKNLKSLAIEGRLVIIAFLHGSRVEVEWRPIMMKRLTVTGSTMRASPTERKGEIAKALRENAWPLLERGAVKPVVHRVFPLAEAAAAHALMESSQHVGKIMLAVRP